MSAESKRGSGLYGILFDTAYNVFDLSAKAVRLVSSKLLRGDQSRSTVRTSRWNRVIVRLDLYLEEGYLPACGTGFFLNVPGSDKDVIVTAAHNLIRPIGREGKDTVTPKIGIRLIDPDTNEQSTVFVTREAYRICKAYEAAPGSGADSADDYGIILLDRRVIDGVPKPREAFGFNIVLAAMDLSIAQYGVVLNAQLGGYPGIHQDTNVEAAPIFEASNGNFGKHADRNLYYHGGTDQGMSGGPVWVNFLGEEIVVGIHNKHEETPGEGNRGVRLNLEVILNICHWSGATNGLLNKAIKANSKTIQGEPFNGFIYIQALLHSDNPQDQEQLCYCWSGPVRDPGLTTFDIIPSQATPTYARVNHTFYIISTGSFASHRTRKFLQFDTNPIYAPKQVALSEKISDSNLIKLVQGGPPVRGAPAAGAMDQTFNPRVPFRILAEQNHDTDKLSKSQPFPEFKLTVWPEDIPPSDDPFGLERARLGLIMRPQRYKIKPPCDFEEFLLD